MHVLKVHVLFLFPFAEPSYLHHFPVSVVDVVLEILTHGEGQPQKVAGACKYTLFWECEKVFDYLEDRPSNASHRPDRKSLEPVISSAGHGQTRFSAVD